LDPNANAGPVNPDPNPKPDDVARPGPVDPTTGQPDHAAETAELKGWFRENAVSLAITAAVVALVCVYLDPIDTLKVVFGLGLVIFIHELGHFLAAKWCDVHVRTFSIGFGPAVPFCSYKWGETTYMVGIIPLGGYVAMVGEGEDGEEAEEDPRSFRKKTVGQRMLIISAGVIMNIILGLACFMAVYLHGVQEKPATLGYAESGGAAWRAGLRTGDTITQIGSRTDPWFNDVRPIVMSSGKDELVPIKWRRGGTEFEGTVTPIRDDGQRFPQLGISPPSKLELISGVKQKVRPYYPGSPAAAAGTGDTKFEPGDKVVKMTDPANPKGPLTPVADFNDYHTRAVLLAKDEIAFEVKRKGSDDTATLTVKPAFRHDLGMRMRMGEVVALRKGGPAAAAGVVARNEGADPRHGDKIKAVLLPPDAAGKRVWYVAGEVDWAKPEFKTENPKAVEVRALDPLLLPHQLNAWGATKTEPTEIELIVGRAAHPTDTTARFPIKFDPSFRFDREAALNPNSPLAVSGLGLAYWVEAFVDEVAPGGPAAGATTTAGELPTGLYYKARRFVGIDGRDVAPGGEHKPLQKNDVITAVRFKATGDDGTLRAGAWKDDLKPQQWASADTVFQNNAAEIDLRVKRGTEEFTVTLKGRPHAEFATDDRGLVFQAESQIQKAGSVGEALTLGGRRTLRFIKEVYMNLYAMIAGRVSAKTMSGPLTIANVSYRLAGEDFWQFLLFLGMISVNLAVVNFLPIPVLDGGHMVFLILEKVLGRPVPERVFAFAMYLGLFLILMLMVFVLFLDVGRLFFGMN